MSDGTKIEWTDATVNVVNGCSVISPGCKHCYAMKQAHRVEARRGLTQKTAGGMVWTGEVRFNETALLQPLRWTRPRRIFWNAHGDLFHENVPDEWIDRCFAVMALTPQHQHQVLTKRSARMREYLTARWPNQVGEVNNPYRCATIAGAARMLHDLGHTKNWMPRVWPLPNVWLGVSVEDQTRADERIPDLLATPAAVRFLSCEPLLAPVDLTAISTMRFRGAELVDALAGQARGMFGEPAGQLPRIDWVIAGGESGHDARWLNPAWVRALRDQCAAAGVPFFFKQWGEWLPLESGSPASGVDLVACAGFIAQRVGKRAAGRSLDGIEHSEMPA